MIIPYGTSMISSNGFSRINCPFQIINLTWMNGQKRRIQGQCRSNLSEFIRMGVEYIPYRYPTNIEIIVKKKEEKKSPGLTKM